MSRSKQCDRCDGKGTIGDDYCPACTGAGEITRDCCEVCGRELITTDEEETGMCQICADE